MYKELSVGTDRVSIEGRTGAYRCEHLINCIAPCGYDLGIGQVVETATFRTERGALAWAHRKLNPIRHSYQSPLFGNLERQP